MSAARWLNRVWQLACLPEARRFHVATRAVEATQRRLLLDLLRRNANTEFGRRHHFDKIRTPRDFRNAVPLSDFADYAPAVKSISQGEQNLLTAEPVLLLEPTSGTTSGQKLIPYTASLRRQFQRGVAVWIADLFGRRPAAASGRAYWSISPALPRHHLATSKVPVGFDDDTAYLSGWEQLLVRRLLAVPSHVARMTDPDDFRYATLLHLLAAPDLSLISVWSPTFLPALLAPLFQWREQLCSDLTRQSHSLRAEEVSWLLRSTSRLGEACCELWPRVGMLSSWADATAAAFVPELTRLFPQAELQPKGLLATEGCITIPLIDRPAPALAIRSHFFEFEPCDDGGLADGRACLLAHELDRGRQYRVVMTTGGGLYRYRLGDIVEVIDFENEAPLLRLLGKGDQASDLVGEKLAEPFVGTAVAALFADYSLSPQFFLMVPIMGRPPRYRLYVQLPAGHRQKIRAESFSMALEHALKSNPYYAAAVAIGQLAPAEVVWLRPDAPSGSTLFSERRMARGQKLGAIKPVALDPWNGWPGVFKPLEEVETAEANLTAVA